MNLFSVISAVAAPKSLWVTLINWVQSFVGNFGWTIILVTLFIKIVMTPLDFFVKLNSKKQSLVQQKCAPQISKLQKKFGADKNSFKIQSEAIYKREGLDMRSGCITMLVSTILSFVIFITFYSDLRKVSSYEAIHEYEQIEATYTDAYYQSLVENDPVKFDSKETAANWFVELNAINAKNEEDRTAEEQTELQYWTDNQDTIFQKATDDASKAASASWKQLSKKSSWLWVQNIWVADSTTKMFPNYETLKSNAKNTGYTPYVTNNINAEQYNKIATIITSSAPRQNNGFYILAILAGVITFASQYIAELHNKLKNKKASALAQASGSATGSSMKMMKIILPAIMVVFVLTASASFGLYILASNLATILLGELITLGVDKATKTKRLEVEAELEKEANKLIRKGKLKG